MNDPNGTKHPVLLLTRRFPDAIMARAARDYRIIANTQFSGFWAVTIEQT